MNYQTLEVELGNGWVHPSGSEILPAKAHAPPAGAEPSLADLARDFMGIGNGTHTDLSTNSRHTHDFSKRHG